MGSGRSGILSALTLALAGVACETPVPAAPSFELDVKPIFEGHCVRCHGAGGKLSGDPRAVAEVDAPSNGFLDRYDDSADCAPDAMGNVAPTCERGALTEAQSGLIELYLHLPTLGRMPLAPAAPLDHWEAAVVENWLAEKPPAP
jgi:hypothetical protein